MQHTSDAKIRIVLEGLRGETGVRQLCWRLGIAISLNYPWSKEFLGAANWQSAVRAVG